MARSWRSQIADEVRATSRMKPKPMDKPVTDASTTGAVERLAPYAVDGGCDAYGQMESDPFGDYVSYEAYQALVAERDAAIQRAEAADSLITELRHRYAAGQVALAEARAQVALAWEAGRDAAAGWIQDRLNDYVQECGSYDGTTGMTEFPGNGEEWVGEQDEALEAIRALTPPAELSAALTARLDAELERIIGEAKSIIEDQNWSGGGLTDAAMEQMVQRLDALRRAAPTEGEA